MSSMRFTAPQLVLASLGYDQFGNNEKLLTAADADEIEHGNYMRVASDAKCRCGVEYRLHPQVQGALWLHRGCDILVKL